MKIFTAVSIAAHVCTVPTTLAFTSPKPSRSASAVRTNSCDARTYRTSSLAVTSLNDLTEPAETTTFDEVTQSTIAQLEDQFEADASTALSPSPLPEAEPAEPAPKSYLDDGFVFGMEGSGLTRPKGKVASVVVEGDFLDTTPQQAAFVSATFAGHAFFAISAILQQFSMNGDPLLTGGISIATILSSWILADFGSGVLHWSVDNYGNGRTPVFGSIIAAFQGHHSAPWTITQRQFCNNVSKLCIPFGVPTVAAIAFLAGPDHPMVALFFAVFCSIEIMSQEFHKWSHMTKSEVPPFANELMDARLSINRVAHSKHHAAPYEGNYCIVSGLCNDLLDTSGFFRRLEHKVYQINGIEANSWKLDPKLRERTLRGEYELPKSRKTKR